LAEKERKMDLLFISIIVFGCATIWVLSGFKLENRNDEIKKKENNSKRTSI
jgi:hypothetical protein